MSKVDHSRDKVTLTRRSLIKGGAAGMAAAAMAVAGSKAASADGPSGGRILTIDVEDAEFTDGPGFPGSVDNFIVVGDIVSVDGQPATGKYFCKGVAFFRGGVGGPSPLADTFVDQRFRIDGEGSIMGMGAEGDTLGDGLAVVGGTGKWVGASGFYMAVSGGPIPFGTGEITFEFKIRRG